MVTFSFGPVKKDSLIVRFWFNETLLGNPLLALRIADFLLCTNVATLTML